MKCCSLLTAQTNGGLLPMDRGTGALVDGTIVETSLFKDEGDFDHDRLISYRLVQEAEAAF